MQLLPDLSRTKLCKVLLSTGRCENPNCTYAHNKDQLRGGSARALVSQRAALSFVHPFGFVAPDAISAPALGLMCPPHFPALDLHMHAVSAHLTYCTEPLEECETASGSDETRSSFSDAVHEESDFRAGMAPLKLEWSVDGELSVVADRSW